MSTGPTWRDLGLPEDIDPRDVTAAVASGNGRRVAFVSRGPRWPFRRDCRPRGDKVGPDRAVRWLRNAMIGLGSLAAAAAVVSFAAQFNMIVSVRHGRMIAALEAGIPDAAAAIFASLGIALALHGKRAIRARLLNVGAVATSVFMNFIAADPGWKNAAIWVMPPVAYALASDTAIGVIRSWTLARARELRDTLADDEVTPLAIVGALCLWLVRLVLAPWSTLCGFRRWVVEECPVAPGRTALPAAPAAASLPTVTGAARAPKPPVTSGSHPVGPGPKPVTPASHPVSDRRGRRRPGAARDWDALTKAYQKRLTGAGVTREAHESGAPLSVARGHQEGASP